MDEDIEKEKIQLRRRIMNIYKVPTGYICTMVGELAKQLEFLSIGDYGKEKNLKADFMGLTKEINGVPHGELLSLSEKWVITISSQYGCSMGCSFCDVPKVGPGINATFVDMINQVYSGIDLHPEIKTTKRLNLHYARMGEPTWNDDVIHSAYWLASDLKNKGWGFHPVVSTMMPKNNKNLTVFIDKWIQLKNNLNGEAGLQLSINTTDPISRKKTMPQAQTLESISETMNVLLYNGILKGRKITLNFALTEAEIDAKYLRELFNPKYFICKITPMHKTKACIDKGIITDDGYDFYYPYDKVEKELKAEGFDVIVFIPSHEEDESKITCGNAILSGEII